MDDHSILEKQAALQEYREASALYRQESFDEAAAILERLIAVYPKHATVRTALAMCRAAIAKRDAEEPDLVPEAIEEEPVAGEAAADEPSPDDLTSEGEDEADGGFILVDETVEVETEAEPGLEPEIVDELFDGELPETPPDPEPFVYEFSTPTPEGRPANTWWQMPAAMVAGVAIGLAAGFAYKDARATWKLEQESLHRPAPIEGQPLRLAEDDAVLLESAPGDLRLSDDLRETIEASEDRGEFTAPPVALKSSPMFRPWEFEAQWKKDGVTAWTSNHGDFYIYEPANARDVRAVTVLVHGAPADPADRPRAALDLLTRPLVQRYADRAASIVLVPVFDGERYGGYARLAGAGMPADAFVSGLLDAVTASYGLTDKRAVFYGHSAGAQFVHRYILVHPERVIRAALSAPGAYVMADDDRPWPDGYAGCPNPNALAWAARIPTLVAVGDSDPRRETARAWVRSVETAAQGKAALDITQVPEAEHRTSHLLPACLEFMVP